jgi:hypothetical protein
MRRINSGETACFDPKRALVFPARFNVDAALAYAGASGAHTKPDAFSAVLEIDGGDGNGAAIGERLPVRFEIVTLKSCAANLFGEETIFDGTPANTPRSGRYINQR